MDDSEVDDFFEGVAGKPGQEQPNGASHRLGITLRAVVLRQSVHDGPLTAEEELKRDALMNSLHDRGLFRNPMQSNVTPMRLARTTKRRYARWTRPVALAAVFSLCAVGVLELLPNPRVLPGMVERGSAELTVRSDDPAGTVQALTQELTQAGAGIRTVQINESTWTMSIEIPHPASGVDRDVRDRVRRVLAQRGVKSTDEDSLSIVVESPPRG